MSDTGQIAEMEWKPSHSPYMIALAVMLPTFMEVLDTSIANVTLPHIAGNLSASISESTWVLTSYLVSNAIILPMTGWLGNRFGRKRFLIVCIAFFTLASFLCGISLNLGMLVFARILQGAGGGALQPISQAILLESFSKEKRGVGMAIFGIGAVVAPIIGPVIGGWLTDNYSWRWVFYINIPIGILAVLLAAAIVEDPPYIKAHKGAPIDTIGFGFLTIWLASLQIVLDKGQDADWFDANWICVMSAISGLAMIAFIIRELTTSHPIVDLRILKNRNFAAGTFIMAVFGFILYAVVTLIPLFLQNLMGYDALSSGLTSSPIGIGGLISFTLAGMMVTRMDGRLMALLGFSVLACACYSLSGVNLGVSMLNFLWPTIVCGLSFGFLFTSLTTITMGTLHNEQMGNASGLFNLMRNLGGSIGISYITTMLSRGAQSHQAQIVSHLTPYHPAYQQWVSQLKGSFSTLSNPGVALQQAYGAIYGTLVKQATLMAVIDNFRLLSFLAGLCMLLMLLFKKVTIKEPILVH